MIDFKKINIGDEIPVLVKGPVDELQFVKYAGASGDFAPIHVIDAAGKTAGFGGVIAQGMLIMGFIAQAVTDFIPNRNLKKLSTRFLDVTRPGDVITIRGLITDKKVVNGEVIVNGEVLAIDQYNKIKAAANYEACC